ncbi:MAG: Cof-type HAD-IIB family hydrolase, partial [Oscillospiraceae bacterium]|nr:Cof-type HAD-IIB family hydrolase [Oscillospiraceae bacterium]
MRGRYERGRTLFISDLDGTLLDRNAALTPYTAEVINRLLASGHRFTVATARTWQSVERLVAGVDLALPLVLMNGVLIYDARERRYLNVDAMSAGAAAGILDIARANLADVLVYTVEGGDFIVEKRNAERGVLQNSQLHRVFMDDVASRRSIDRFVRGLDAAVGGEAFYFTFADTYDRMRPVCDAARELPGVAVVMSKDDYTADGWFVECFSENASKANAVRFLRESFGFEYV